MNHFKPHPSAAFEGYYTHIRLPSGSTIILIICAIHGAPHRAHQSHLTYVSATGHIWQQQCWPAELRFLPLDNDSTRSDGFRMIGSGGASTEAVNGRIIATTEEDDRDAANEEFSLTANGDTTTLTHKTPTASFTFHTSSRTSWLPWSHSSTPESWLAYLPLPLHWHVHSLSSPCTIQLSLPASANLLPEDTPATPNSPISGIAHLEKNWAHSFPSAHIWVWGRVDSSSPSPSTKSTASTNTLHSLNIAGGSILSTTAFLLSYHNPHPSSSPSKPLALTFTPPFSLALHVPFLPITISPFCTHSISWPTRTFTLSVQNLFYKLVVRAQAEEGSFYPLSGPFVGGHKENWLAQSQRGEVFVEVWKRGWRRLERSGVSGSGVRLSDGKEQTRPWWSPIRAFHTLTAKVLGEWQLVCTDSFERAGLEFGGEYYPLRGTDRWRN